MATSSNRWKSWKTDISASFSLFLIHFLLLLPLCCAANQRLDVCAAADREAQLQWQHVHEGVFIDLSTGQLAGVLVDAAGEECAIDLILNETAGERTEVSFFKAPEKDAEDCFDITYEDR